MDVLCLVNEIRKRPALWDLHNKDHKFRKNVSESWKEVAASMGQKITVDECKQKWKNIRDAYRAEIKRKELRIETDKLKGTFDQKKDYSSKWILFKHMTFIKDIKRPRRKKNHKNQKFSTSVSNNDINELDDFSEFHDIENIKLESNNKTNSETYSLDSESVNNDTETSKDVIKEAKKETPLLNSNSFLQNTSQSQMSERSIHQDCYEDLEEEKQSAIKSARSDVKRSSNLDYIGDSDYNFLISYLPQIKKMNEVQNLQFRSKISNLILDIISQPMT